MSRKKGVGGMLMLFDSPHRQFTLDEFLRLVEDVVSVQIKHGRLEEQYRKREVAFLMTYWHREPFVTAGDVICINQRSSDSAVK
jgi:hypothetical protein